MGYLGAPVAEEYGGRGLDYLSYGLIVEEVGRADSSARTVVSVQTSLVCGSIERWGTEEQKRRLAAAPVLRRGAGLLRAHRARRGIGPLRHAHPGAARRRQVADQRPEDVDLARQLRRGRDRLRADRPREAPPRHRLLPGAHLDRGLLHPGDPRQARAAGLRHRLARLRRGRGARGRAAGGGRRRVQDRDDGARLRALLGRRRVRRDLRGMRPGARPTTRPSAGSSGSRSPASSSSRR